MAVPLSPDRLFSAARSVGARVVEVGSWRTHNRNHVGRWGPVHGIMIHYTAGDSGPPANDAAYNRNILYSGYAGLPGPLSQFGIARDATVFLNSAGRCNHAGRIDDDALDLLIRSFASVPAEGADTAFLVDPAAFALLESGALPLDDTLAPADDEPDGLDGVFGLLPLDRTHVPGADVIDGNARLYGIEIINRGTPSEAQLDAAARVCAGICLAHGWSGADVMGHGEGTRRKTNDPPGVNMGHFRRRVMALVAAARAPKPAPAPAPAPPVVAVPVAVPTPQEEDDMSRFIETPTEFTHPGGNGWWTDFDRPVIGASVIGPVEYIATATVVGPEGANLRTRWAILNRKTGEWLGRTDPVEHAGAVAEVIRQGHSGGVPEMSVFVDVWSDTPGPVRLEQQVRVWGAR